MSLGAWGDEGNFAETWEENAMYQDFLKLRNDISNWVRMYNGEFPNKEFETLVRDFTQSADDVQDEMQGKL
jgi:hypothetical protein